MYREQIVYIKLSLHRNDTRYQYTHPPFMYDQLSMTCKLFGKKLTLVLTVATLVTGTADEVMVASVVRCGGVCVWQDSEVCSQEVFRCVWRKCNFTRLEDSFTFNLL